MDCPRSENRHWGPPRGTYLLKSKRSFSKMRMGPVLLRMMRGCPEKRQNKEPAMAVPRKLSITPWGHKEFEAPWRQEKGLLAQNRTQLSHLEPRPQCSSFIPSLLLPKFCSPSPTLQPAPHIHQHHSLELHLDKGPRQLPLGNLGP